LGERDRGYFLFFTTSGQNTKKAEKIEEETEGSRDEGWWLSFEVSKSPSISPQTSPSDQVRWGNFGGFVNGVELRSTKNNSHVKNEMELKSIEVLLAEAIHNGPWFQTVMPSVAMMHLEVQIAGRAHDFCHDSNISNFIPEKKEF
jgi:hypothetical protein